MFALAGMMVMVAATDLLIMLLGLETMSLAVYGLVASRRSSARSAEAGLKYFMNGAIASALLVFGMALVWGETGSIRYAEFGASVAQGGNPMLFAGVTMLLAAFAFKIAAVPFHLWTPDAYEGAPTPVTGFMASAVKTAAFLALARLVFLGLLPEAFKGMAVSYVDAVIFIAIVSMTVGNLAALHQKDVKRMLAYSSIAHAGYMLMALALVPTLGSRLTGLNELTAVFCSTLWHTAWPLCWPLACWRGLALAVTRMPRSTDWTGWLPALLSWPLC
jgi:NADH-quinone oxidoreductase subunit N